jgi:putative membrane protein
MRGLLIRWVLTSFALWLTAVLLPGFVSVEPGPSVLIAGLVLGLVNALVRPIAILLTLPFTLVTLGLFLILINAGMFALAALLAGDKFQVHGFWGAVVGSLLMGLISLVLNSLIGESGRVKRLRSGYED